MENKTYDTTIKILWYTIIIVIVLNLICDFQNFILVGLAALLASATVMKSIANTNRIEEQKKQKEESEFYLNKSISELTNVYDLLKDKNNDRVTWILAARVLAMALELSKKIKCDNHKEFYNLQKLQLKHKLLDLFKSEEYSKLAFYIGCENPLQKDDINAIAEYIKNSDININLDETSLYEIFTFLEYPDDFKDPLYDDKVPDNDDKMEAWTNQGSLKKFKEPIKKYFDTLNDKNNVLSKVKKQLGDW